VPPADSAIRAINRICDILNSFSEDDRALSLTEISRRIGLPKSTTYRFLEALESQGMLTREPQNQGFQLGYQLIRWGTLAQNGLDLRNLAIPILQELSTATGETAILSVRYGTVGIWLEVVESRQPVRLTRRVGQRLWLHAGASSKVLWAFLPEAEREQLFQEVELVPLRPSTITEPEAMRAELAAIRQRGYATSFEETDEGAMGIAAPVYNHTGQLVAGIGIAAPLSRVPPERIAPLAEQVLAAGRALSLQLGAAPR
jgi:DNA-binding IclR family transcriptional regulator